MKKRRLVYRAKKTKSAEQRREDELYHKYVIRYNRARKKLAKQGFVMREEKYNKAEFLSTLQATINDLNAEIKKGSRKKLGDVVGYIIDKQKFEITSKQAKAIISRWKHFREWQEEELGFWVSGTPTQYEVRSGQAFDFELIKAEYHYWRSKGKDSYEAAEIIKEHFYI